MWRIPALPLLALGGALGILKAWESFRVVGIALTPFFAVAALIVHIRDMVRVARSPVRVIGGEALGRLSEGYDETTFAFELGRRRDLLVDIDSTEVLTVDGRMLRVDGERGCQSFRTTRRVRRSLASGQDVALVVVDYRAFDTLRTLASKVRNTTPAVASARG